MGQIADDAYNGITCSCCGAWMPECFITINGNMSEVNQEFFDNPPGYARICDDCAVIGYEIDHIEVL